MRDQDSEEPVGQGALAGVRIIDMATVFAAPFGATLCADQGAEVIKLELPDGSDALRGLQPVKEGVPLWFKVANRGKKGISLDVRQAEGRELFLRMLPDVDVLIENFRTGTMDRWGLDLETLHKANPRLIVVRLTGFGQTGPYARRAGFARIFEAMSGLTNLTGEEGGQPLHSNFPIGDAIAGVFCAFSVAAEVARLRGNPSARGTEVDLSATEAVFRMLDFLPVEHAQLGLARGHSGNRTSYTAPSNMYCSSDRHWFTLVASSNPIFERLCSAIDRPEMSSDPAFESNPLRVRNMAALDAQLEAWFSDHSMEEISLRLDRESVPFTRVYDIGDIEKDPHFIAREAILQLPDPEFGTLPAPCIVPRVTGRPTIPPRTGPATGEHNDEIYGELGLSDADLAALRAAKVI